MRQIIGFDRVLATPEQYVNFDLRGGKVNALVSEVAEAAIVAREAGANPAALPGVLASLSLEDAGAIQRRIAVIEAVPESASSAETAPYRQLMVAALRAKARYLLSLN